MKGRLCALPRCTRSDYKFCEFVAFDLDFSLHIFRCKLGHFEKLPHVLLIAANKEPIPNAKTHCRSILIFRGNKYVAVFMFANGMRNMLISN